LPEDPRRRNNEERREARVPGRSTTEEPEIQQCDSIRIGHAAMGKGHMKEGSKEMEKIKIGVSRCLLGEKVRYDGQLKLDDYITGTLGRYFDFVGVCPEVEYGLPVPREAMRLTGNPDAPRLVTVKGGVDHTEGMLGWARDRLDGLAKEGLLGFIFKSKSPSSGMQGVKVYGPSGVVSPKGVGIFARTFMERFPLVPTEDEGRLHDPALSENFIERIFVFKRWQEFLMKGGLAGDLREFHRDQKLLIMAHSPKHLSDLGRYMAGSKAYAGRLNDVYGATMTKGLCLIATVRKQTNVLHHVMGYFKKQLSGEEKNELLEAIGAYHDGLLPLMVPMALLRHYVRKYDQPYLKRQLYLNPHPVELMLRNHA
jgi:uncharacterized protein YbgA (DUF1722 family)/uncharacterized protein YbbK (DUF523 family)